MRQIAATHRLDRVAATNRLVWTCENHGRCARQNLSLRSVARIQTGLISCTISQRQNKRKKPYAICAVAICHIVCLGLYTTIRHSKTKSFREISKLTACISVLGPEIKLTTFFVGHIERTFRNEIFSSQLNIDCLFAGLKRCQNLPPKLNWCAMFADLILTFLILRKVAS